jgi:hypothetical protein
VAVRTLVNLDEMGACFVRRWQGQTNCMGFFGNILTSEILWISQERFGTICNPLVLFFFNLHELHEVKKKTLILYSRLFFGCPVPFKLVELVRFIEFNFINFLC